MPQGDNRIVWAPAARNDLRKIWRYFADVASPEIADRLLRDIATAGKRVAERPLGWRARDEVMPGLRSILVPPYVLFYRIGDGTVEIVRVLHQRRNFAAIFSRR